MKEKQLKRKVVILLSDRVNTPVTYGIFSPKIILPRTMDLTDHKALRFVLEHELVHIKCHDNLWKIVALAALCIHWFNPIVWIMQILFNRDLELTCDEKVITSVGAEQRQEYALTLINLAGNKSGISFLHSSFGKNVIKERIVSIMKYKKTSALPEISSYTSSGFVTKIEGSTMYLQEEGHGDSKVAYELINAVINIPNGVRMNQTVEVHYYTKDGKNVATEVNGDGTGTKPIDTGDYFSGSYELAKDGLTVKLSISSYTDLYTSARGNVMGTIINNDGTESGFYGELIMTDTVNQYDVTTDSGLTCSFVFSGDT